MDIIPKVVHYCWFGGNPLPKDAIKCIESWKRYLPNYEIKEWNESNFDVKIIPYTAEAYEKKKYAFVSDYARFWILYHYGGLYFDTDVEVIKGMDDIIEKGPFMGCENEVKFGCTSLGVAPGLGLGVTPGLGLYKDILDYYESIHYVLSDGRINPNTVVTITESLLIKKGLKVTNEIQCIDGVYIYPKEYFCPLNYTIMKLDITKNTRSIHLYSGTWQTPVRQWVFNKMRSKSFLPPKFRRHVLYVIGYIKFEGVATAIKEIFKKK
jgi:mannosyltransferase OCH1-like enzyme